MNRFKIETLLIHKPAIIIYSFKGELPFGISAHCDKPISLTLV